MIRAISCVDNNWAIGKKGGLLFNLKLDMTNFKITTKNSIVVMGENTLLSLPNSKPLKNRVNIVLCPEGHEYEDCICYHNFDTLLKDITILSKVYNVFIIGGGMLYISMLPYYDEVLITKVDAADPEATVFFPNLDKCSDFKCIESSSIFEEAGYKFKFCEYKKIK